MWRADWSFPNYRNSRNFWEIPQFLWEVWIPLIKIQNNFLSIVIVSSSITSTTPNDSGFFVEFSKNTWNFGNLEKAKFMLKFPWKWSNSRQNLANFCKGSPLYLFSSFLLPLIQKGEGEVYAGTKKLKISVKMAKLLIRTQKTFFSLLFAFA